MEFAFASTQSNRTCINKTPANKSLRNPALPMAPISYVFFSPAPAPAPVCPSFHLQKVKTGPRLFYPSVLNFFTFYYFKLDHINQVVFFPFLVCSSFHMQTLSCVAMISFIPPFNHELYWYARSLYIIDPTLLHNLPHTTIILPSILIVQSTRLRIRRRTRVRITQQTLNTGQYRRNIINGTPLIL